MLKKQAVISCVFVLLSALLIVGFSATAVSGWSNGGYSGDQAHPDYGTHDWIAQHALDWLPTNEKQYITDNLAAYLYGTELPDNNNASAPGHIGDTTKHHIYYRSTGTLQDDAAAVRAATEYQTALNCLNQKDYADAAKTAGIMSHYIIDVGVWAHVMGASTDWGSETGNNHSNYENYVDTRTNSYSDTYNQYLSFDGNLQTISAYDAAKNLANDTTFNHGGTYTCTWMNNNYNISNPTYWNRAGESLNLAVNALTDVLHTLYVSSNPQSTPTPTPTATPTPTPTTAPTQTPTATASPSLSASTTPTITSTPTQAPTATPYSSQNPTPSPTIPEFPVGFPLAVLLLCVVAVAVYLRQKHHWKKPYSLRA